MDHPLANPKPPSSSALPGTPMGPTDELKDIGMIRESVWVLSIEVGAPVVRETPRLWDTQDASQSQSSPTFSSFCTRGRERKTGFNPIRKTAKRGRYIFEKRIQNTNEGDGVECPES